MTPDDPRHGTHAGYMAHYRDNEKACPQCREANAEYERTRRDRSELRRLLKKLVCQEDTE